MRVYLDQSHRNHGNHKTVLNMSVKTVLTHFSIFFLISIYQNYNFLLVIYLKN